MRSVSFLNLLNFEGSKPDWASKITTAAAAMNYIGVFEELKLNNE